MEELIKSIRVNRLFDMYGDLLTENQKKMISLHYQLDLSLGEIAEQEGISRNAVFDSIKKGLSLLENYEEKLSLIKNEDELKDYLSSIKNGKSNDVIALIQQIEERIKR